jgi:hypothetical protein
MEMKRLATSMIMYIQKFYESFKRFTKVDDKKLWIEVPTIYMSTQEKQNCISNAVNILERNIKIK